MANDPTSDNRDITVRDLYPDLTDEELRVAEENLERYLELELRVSRLDAPEEILIPREGQVRVVTALEQELIAAVYSKLLTIEFEKCFESGDGAVSSRAMPNASKDRKSARRRKAL